MSVLGRNSSAEDKTTCKDVIKACDRAIAAQKEEIEIRENESNLMKEQIKAQQEQIEAKEAQLNSKLRKPGVLVGTGVLITAAGGPLIGGLAALLTVLIF